MPRRRKIAVPNYAPAQLLISLVQQLPRIADFSGNRTRAQQPPTMNEASLTKTRRVGSTGVFAWRPAAGEIAGSEQIHHIFDLDPAARLTPELLGSRIHPEDLSLFHDMLHQARGAVRDFDFRARLRLSDDSIRHLHLVLYGHERQDGQLEYIGAVHDLTSERILEEALNQARADLTHASRLTTLGILTGSIVHEINQPLTGIMTNASTCLRMLDADPPDLDGARATARRTIRDVELACDLMTRLRALFSKKQTTSDCVDLNEAIQEVITLTLSELCRNRVVLRVALARDLPPVRGDRVQLQQVVLNLLLNASDALSGVDDRPRDLLIRTESQDGGQVCVTVRDAGVGFQPAEVNRLFEAFYTTKSHGLGIGLSISRTIIEKHRGRLWAERSKDHGASFSFSLPHGPPLTCTHSAAVSGAAM
jgi:C4-dicarboxylate-specific signal transduction histidine kinase